MKKDDILVLGAPSRGRSMSITGLDPGLHQARIISMDFSKLEDYTVAVMAALSKTGTVMIENIIRVPFRKPKIHSFYDMIDMSRYEVPRYAHNRHHKAKAQPNRGPKPRCEWQRSKNQW